MHRPLICAAAAAGLFAAVPAQAHNYPTATIADYVFGCMAANGQTHEMLEKCSCSIDVISSIVPLEEDFPHLSVTFGEDEEPDDEPWLELDWQPDDEDEGGA